MLLSLGWLWLMPAMIISYLKNMSYIKIEVLNEQRSFDDLQSRRLGSYVYGLKDPRDNKIFYVGQGVGDRVFSHFGEAEGLMKGNTSYSSKRARIVDIWSEREDVVWIILAHNLHADTVNHVEAAIINSLEVSQNGQCLNVVRGPESSVLTSGEVYELGARPVSHDLKAKLMFIFPCHNAIASAPDSVYQATRAYWKVNKKYHGRESLAVGVRNGISIGGFSIDSWDAHKDKFVFSGTEVPELLNFDWKQIINTSIGYWQRGNYHIVELNGEGLFRFVHGCSDRDWKKLI